jgi:hypothetical protein
MSYQSVTFGSNGEVVNTDLESHVRPANAMSDSAKAGINIATKAGGLFTYNTGSDAPATHRNNTTSVQLLAKTGLVKVGNFEVTPDVAATLSEVAPNLTEDPSVKAMEAAKVAEVAKAEEITREELNRHPDEIEGYHQHILGEVPQQDIIGLMVYGQRGEAIPPSLIHRIAEAMGEPVDTAVQKLNLVKQGVDAQFTTLARSMGLDANRAATWIAEHRKDTAMIVAQAHYMRRDLMAWKPLLADYRAATGDGVKH